VLRFFCSSRRRHTRFSRDWSSDVCSSDLYLTGGEVRYCGTDILGLPEEQRRAIRGAEISMVFQDALSALNPVFPVGWQIAEMFRDRKSVVQGRGGRLAVVKPPETKTQTEQ